VPKSISGTGPLVAASGLKTIVITGGIGSGKTTVSDSFASLGVQVIDTDVIAHDICAPGADGFRAIEAEFGDRFLSDDGTLDRIALRVEVFSNPARRRQLEGLLHPLILSAVEHQLRQLSLTHPAPPAYVLLVVPLFFERMTFRQIAWRVLAVDCPVETQIRRVRQRSGMTEVEIARVLQAQVPRQIRLQLSDDVVSNGGDLDALRRCVGDLHLRYRGLAS
jgi:dephospho-CoA kinase